MFSTVFSQTEFSVTGFLIETFYYLRYLSIQCFNSSTVVLPSSFPTYAFDIPGSAVSLKAAHSDIGLV